MESLEGLQKILNDAPEDATHVTYNKDYFKLEGAYLVIFDFTGRWSAPIFHGIDDIFHREEPMLLADIQRIVDLSLALQTIKEEFGIGVFNIE